MPGDALIQILNVTVNATSSLVVAHSLNVNGTPVKPDEINLDRLANGLDVNPAAVTTTAITVSNPTAAPITGNILLTAWHTLSRQFGNGASGAFQGLSPQPFVASGTNSPGSSGGGSVVSTFNYSPVWTAGNSIDTRGPTNDQCRAIYMGRAPTSLTSIQIYWGQTAVGTMNYAEMGIATGPMTPGTAPNLVLRGFVDVTADWSGAPANVLRTIPVTGAAITAGTDIWACYAASFSAGAPTIAVSNVSDRLDTNAIVLRTFEMAQTPPAILNVTGPETVSIRQLAKKFGGIFQVEPLFENTEADTALLSNASRCHHLFGYPTVTLQQMIEWVAHWVKISGLTLAKPTHYETRNGQF